MAVRSTQELGQQFPVHYEGRGLRVYDNGSGEIFVEDIATGQHLRISSHPGGLRFTTDGRLDPEPYNGTIAWQVRPR